MKIKHIAYTMYPVKNMKRARNFYEKVLGLKLGKDFDGAWVEYYPGSGCFAITTMDVGSAPSTKAGGSIAFEVDDLEKAVKRLSAAKAKCLLKPMDTPFCRLAAYRDTEGNAFVIHVKRKRPLR